MRAQCTTSKEGRSVRLHPKHYVLDAARKRQRDPGWRARYRATRPKVERKIAHLMRRKHGGRRPPLPRGPPVRPDFTPLAAPGTPAAPPPLAGGPPPPPPQRPAAG